MTSMSFSRYSGYIFSGEADKSKSTYFNSSGLDVLEIIQIGFIFDRVIPDIIGWLF